MSQQDDDLAQMPMWKSYLYHLQQQAPKPKRISAQRDVPNRPPYYGREYHGAISREDADFMLTIGGEGSYLIRESQRAPGQYTLAIRFEGVTKNFKLYYDNQHYVGEKRFDTIHDLVADGLITFYLESKAADYIAALSNQSNYAESPYIAYNTHKKHQVAAVSASRRASGPRSSAGNEPASSAVQRSSAALTDGQEPGGHSQLASRGNRAANIPLERTRLSQIAESRRSQSDSPGPVSRQTSSSAAHSSSPQQPAGPVPAAVPAVLSKQPARSSQQVVSTPSRTQSSSTANSASAETPAAPSAAEARTSASTNTDGPMLEDLTSPPSSPPLGVTGGTQAAVTQDGAKQHNFKASSVTWCTDYLEVMGCEKQHNFKLHTFKGPHWCDYCANFLWGLIAQGVKCQDCGLNAHKRCSEKVPNDCLPDMKYIKRMFGIDLTTLVKAQNTLIPAVVELCIKEIESRGLTSEGLYRVAGFHDDVEAIKMAFDKDGEQADISVDRYDDVNTIASVLKLYFRLLPIPLITFDIYFKLIDTVKREDITNDKRLDVVRHSLSQLPPAHYHTLKYLTAHLHRVTEHQQQNMMSPENMAIVFAPTLLRSPETDPLISLSVVKYERELIELLILHHNVLFD